MPARLRPTAPIAAGAILVGDPGRSLMLAQELLESPRMSNHARGLWGYTGQTPGGEQLSIQATGMGGPSAAVVLTDLAALGVRRAIRVGTCTALDAGLRAGALLCVAEAHGWGGPGATSGAAVRPDPALRERLAGELGATAPSAVVASLDTLHGGGEVAPVVGAAAADMQTAALFARGGELGVSVAATLIVTETATGDRLSDAEEQSAAKRAGQAALAVLST